MPLTIHFVNVGRGDCTIIEFDSGRIVMVDINNSKVLPNEDKKSLAKSLGYSDIHILVAEAKRTLLKGLDRYENLLADPVDYLKEEYPNAAISTFILTHPHMNHMSGLSKLVSQECISISNFWDTNNFKKMSTADFQNSPNEYADWVQYQTLRAGVDKDNEATVLKLGRGASGNYHTEDGIFILSPTKELEQLAEDNGNYNISSYVLLIKYGACKIILGGDAEEATWKNIYFNYTDEFLSSTLLKASHHGRKSGYYQPVLKAISPKYTIVSVGKKPETDVSHLYAQYSDVFSTRYHGTITAKCWANGDILLYNHENNRIQVQDMLKPF